jgi:hypothetical protein
MMGSGAMSSENESEAIRIFKINPQLRDQIMRAKEFEEWRKDFKSIEIDGETYFIARGIPMVSGGDRLMDEDELMLEWARLTGLYPGTSKKE